MNVDLPALILPTTATRIGRPSRSRAATRAAFNSASSPGPAERARAAPRAAVPRARVVASDIGTSPVRRLLGPDPLDQRRGAGRQAVQDLQLGAGGGDLAFRLGRGQLAALGDGGQG